MEKYIEVLLERRNVRCVARMLLYPSCEPIFRG